MYLHPLPTTGSISFSDFLNSSSFVPELAQATELRANLREILKSSSHSIEKEIENQEGDGQGYGSNDWFKLVKAVDDYLPYLFSIFNCTQTDDLILKYEPEFSWRTPLCSPTLLSSQTPRVTLPSLYYELCSILLLYGYSLSNLSFSLVSSLGPYESDSKLSSQERKQKDERLKWSAENLCKASGIFDYLAEVLIPKWEIDKGRIEGRPKDTTRECARALAKLTLADAQLLSIRKLLSPSLSHSIETLTPGPPLSSNHPSPSLLAKLHLNVESLYTSSSSLLKTSGSNSKSKSNNSKGSSFNSSSPNFDSIRSNSQNSSSQSGIKKTSKVFSKLKLGGNKDERTNPSEKLNLESESFLEKERERISNLELSTSSTISNLSISDSLLTYLSNEASLANSLAYKWLGIDSGENRNQIGQGISFLNVSLSGLLENQKQLKDGKILNKLKLGKGKMGKSVKDEMKRNREIEIENVQHWKKSYVKLNDTVTFQPIPSASTLSSLIPAGRSSLNAKPFKPPQPTFGPGSPGFISEGMKRLGLEEGVSRLDLGLGTNDLEDRNLFRENEKRLVMSLGLGSIGGGGNDLRVSNPLNPDGNKEEGSYAGAGAYY